MEKQAGRLPVHPPAPSPQARGLPVISVSAGRGIGFNGPVSMDTELLTNDPGFQWGHAGCGACCGIGQMSWNHRHIVSRRESPRSENLCPTCSSLPPPGHHPSPRRLRHVPFFQTVLALMSCWFPCFIERETSSHLSKAW